MPDLTVENRTVCLSNVTWSMKAPGSAIVTWGWRHAGATPYGYDCTCGGAEGPDECPHIKFARGQRCTWNADHGSSDHPVACPLCNGPVQVVRIAV